MEILPDGEQFVGTRGGGMDHAASLASRAGCASLIASSRSRVRHMPIPPDWGFLVANSLIGRGEIGRRAREYNARRNAGTMRSSGSACDRIATPRRSWQRN